MTTLQELIHSLKEISEIEDFTKLEGVEFATSSEIQHLTHVAILVKHVFDAFPNLKDFE